MTNVIREQANQATITPKGIIARAAAMREELSSECEANNANGGCSVERHEKFKQAGFYRMLAPKVYGGFEMDLETFLSVVIEIGRADPGTAWGMGLSAGHALHLAAYFPEEAQREGFADQADFICPQRALPSGRAEKVEGGYVLTGDWAYASGVPHSNWFMGAANAFDQNQQPIAPIGFIIPREQIEVLNDWGGDLVLGLQATGSNTIRITKKFIPDRWTALFDWPRRELGEDGTIGYQLHANPLYLGRIMTYFGCELAAPMVGAAKGALDEYKRLIESQKTNFPPPMPRSESHFFQQWYGEAMGMVDAAELLLLGTARRYTAACDAWARDRTPFTCLDDARMRQTALMAGKIACDAIQLMFTSSGTTAARTGSRLLRFFKDASTYRTHVTSQWQVMTHSAGKGALGFGVTL
ncbi:acyl-CoA dehydrogenase [Nitrospirillum viridazoti Y2]|uniref:3-hydroxy-9,10-secoandrosta-1,3,5(10)-triene-9, 17-dione monooxygenase n=1 Tax=Nitrospirillum amazonense TaxID=28077 RepID=A0A560IQY1_9PROT|nr:acyl-CoA dehydrogenase family protein [Nitrospirillum amazonense]EGX99504.1 acyl-CoA dehydrogenase [Nitrospirillum amazonense Y2]TWB60675.1 3-hydroxy-9,10-secoandrosta-1,3,5(10)-triene-9,17-dione monooxygenase [Nitrospirillum amazonense]